MGVSRVEAFKTDDGEMHATLAAAELHQAELDVMRAMEEAGVAGGLELNVLRYTLFDAAAELGPLLVVLAQKQAAAGE